LLHQILESWEPQEYANYFDQVEAALTAAVQDALGDTRTNGRTAFAAYAVALPDRASALLRRFDGGLQQKLHEAVVAYGKGQTGTACVTKQHLAGRCICKAHPQPTHQQLQQGQLQ
jgi:hypothetical protein